MPSQPNTQISLSQFFLAALFILAGVLHFVAPTPYLRIMPPYLPYPLVLVYLSGIAEITGGAGVLFARTRYAAGIGLILLLIAIFPANVQMLLDADRAPLLIKLLYFLRLPLQGVLIVWAWRATRPSPLHATK